MVGFKPRTRYVRGPLQPEDAAVSLGVGGGAGEVIEGAVGDADDVLADYFIGCMFGVGCAFAVLYTIYLGGYRRGVRDAMSDEKPPRYRKAVEFNRRHTGTGLFSFGIRK